MPNLSSSESNEILDARIKEIEKEILRQTIELKTQEGLLQSENKKIRVVAAEGVLRSLNEIEKLESNLSASLEMLSPL